MAIGIDLGTSNSCVAIARGESVQVIPNGAGEPITASIVSLPEDGAVLIGSEAKAQATQDPSSTVAAFKRLIGRYFFSEEVDKAKAVCSYEIVEGPNHSVHIRVRDESFPIPEISALVLRELKESAEAHLGEPVHEAVITVPAYFNDNQRQATRDAGRIAGLQVLRLLNEPTAAALAYGFGKGLSQKVAVYDLGGGTFDISILEIGRDIYEVLATCGDTFLGGEDYDDRVLDLIADEFQQQHDINLRGDRFAFEALKRAAEQAKRDLSKSQSASVRIPGIAKDEAGQALNVARVLSREEFDQLTADLSQRTFQVCDEAFQQANLTVRDIDGVILVGGPTRLPTVRQAVARYFQQEPKIDADPDQVVAMGAAIHAASLSGAAADAHLLDVTPLSLRIGVAGGLAETIIERNTPVPIEQSRTFTTFTDNQDEVRLRIYQGESRQASLNEALGEFEFSGFRAAPRGEIKIEVTFEIDTDGLVNVTACDRSSGETASTEVRLSAGLSEEEIQAIIAKQQAADAAAKPLDIPPRVELLPGRIGADRERAAAIDQQFAMGDANALGPEDFTSTEDVDESSAAQGNEEATEPSPWKDGGAKSKS